MDDSCVRVFGQIKDFPCFVLVYILVIFLLRVVITTTVGNHVMCDWLSAWNVRNVMEKGWLEFLVQY